MPHNSTGGRPMAQFMIFLHGGDFGPYSREEMQAVSARYLAWRQKVAGSARTTGGAPLADEIKSLRDAAPHTKVNDGPFTETKEVIGGYYFVEAESLEEAVEFSRDCPHLDFGGTVEVRRVIQ